MSIEYKVEVRNTELRKFLEALFTDADGISEEAYVALDLMLERMFPDKAPHFVVDIMRHVEATDGRFYLPMDWREENNK